MNSDLLRGEMSELKNGLAEEVYSRQLSILQSSAKIVFKNWFGVDVEDYGRADQADALETAKEELIDDLRAVFQGKKKRFLIECERIINEVR